MPRVGAGIEIRGPDSRVAVGGGMLKSKIRQKDFVWDIKDLLSLC